MANSEQRRQERKKEQRLVDRVVARLLPPPLPQKKYLWDIGAMCLGTGLRFAVPDMPQALYWIGVVLGYCGMLALLMHLWNDNAFLSAHRKVRRALAVLVTLTFMIPWSQTIFVEAPLTVSAVASLGNYAQGVSPVPGLPWDATMYQDGRLTIGNPSDIAYKDIDITIKADLWILGAHQLSGFSKVEFSPVNSVTVRGTWINGTDERGNVVSKPGPMPIDLTRPTGLRITCDKLLKRSEVDLLLILAALNRANGLRPPDKMFSEKRIPKSLTVEGSYRVYGRVKSVTQTIAIGSVVP